MPPRSSESRRNLVDEIWTDQPPVPRQPVRVHALEYAGVAVPEKLAAMRRLVRDARASSLLIMAMDEVRKRSETRGVSYDAVRRCAGIIQCTRIDMKRL